MNLLLVLFVTIVLSKSVVAQPAGIGEPHQLRRSGYTNINDVIIGYEARLRTYGYTLGLQTIHAYRFGPHLSLGIGIAFERNHGYGGGDYYVLPVFIDFRTTFTKSKVSPFFYGDVGYSVGLFDSPEGGGVMLAPGIGVAVKVSERTSLTYSLGYKVQVLSYHVDPYPGPSYTSYYPDGNFTFKVGLRFDR